MAIHRRAGAALTAGAGGCHAPPMGRAGGVPAKIVRPVASGLLRRPRLFRLLDRGPRVVWLHGPPGAGKTALASSHVEAGRRPCAWYQLDARDGELAAFFHYM